MQPATCLHGDRDIRGNGEEGVSPTHYPRLHRSVYFVLVRAVTTVVTSDPHLSKKPVASDASCTGLGLRGLQNLYSCRPLSRSPSYATPVFAAKLSSCWCLGFGGLGVWV